MWSSSDYLGPILLIGSCHCEGKGCRIPEDATKFCANLAWVGCVLHVTSPQQGRLFERGVYQVPVHPIWLPCFFSLVPTLFVVTCKIFKCVLGAARVTHWQQVEAFWGVGPTDTPPQTFLSWDRSCPPRPFLARVGPRVLATCLWRIQSSLLSCYSQWSFRIPKKIF